MSKTRPVRSRRSCGVMQLERAGAQPLRADALPQPAVSLVIPVFNEAASIPRLHTRLHRVLQQLGRSFEVVYVDDGSTDRSLEELLVIQGWDPAVKVVTLARNAGQHAAVLAGFAHARGAVVVTLDADLQNPPEEIPRLLAEIDAGHDAVGTRREGRNDPFLRRAISAVVSRLASLAVRGPMTDCRSVVRASSPSSPSCSSSWRSSSSPWDSSANTWVASTPRCAAGRPTSSAPSIRPTRRSRARRRDGLPGHRVRLPRRASGAPRRGRTGRNASRPCTREHLVPLGRRARPASGPARSHSAVRECARRGRNDRGPGTRLSLLLLLPRDRRARRARSGAAGSAQSAWVASAALPGPLSGQLGADQRRAGNRGDAPLHGGQARPG